MKKKRSTKRLKHGLILLTVTAVLIGLFVYVPFFTLHEIKLIGATYLTRDDIMRVANIYYGEPLFELETDEVSKRLLNDLRIEEVKVKRNLRLSFVIMDN